MQRVPCCRQHYQHHGGGGREIKIYRGPIYNQAGGGFFGDVFRRTVPILTSRVLPFLGKKIYAAGEDVMKNVNEGQSFGKAIKRTAKRTWEESKDEALRKLTGGGKKRKVTGRVKKRKISKKKRRVSKKKSLTRKKSHKKRMLTRDYLSH